MSNDAATITPDRGFKPGASDRERSDREHGVWVSRPYGLRARETRARDARAWRAAARLDVDATL